MATPPVTVVDVYVAFHDAGPGGLAMADLNRLHKTDPDRPRVLPTERAAAGRHLRQLIDAAALEAVGKGRWRAVAGADWRPGDPVTARATRPVPQARPGVDLPADQHANLTRRPRPPGDLTVDVDPALLQYADPDERRALGLYLVQHSDDWRTWVPALFPQFTSRPFASFHETFWDQIWSIEDGKPFDPIIAIWSRGAAKSTSTEMAVTALGARKKRRYVWYCHETGTRILDPDHGWLAVDDHPTAIPRIDDGYRIQVAGLPWNLAETVTSEHRYWVRRIAVRTTKAAEKGYDNYRTAPGWSEARMIDWNTWIGLPIDRTIVDQRIPLEEKISRPTRTYAPGAAGQRSWLDDPEWWWLIGLWWGDGTLGGARNSQIAWSMGDAHPEYLERLNALLQRHGYNPGASRPKSGAKVTNVYVADTALANWLHTWKQGKNRKEPPPWIEQLPLEKQRHLLAGYLAADGSHTDRGASLSSIHLPGLLAVRRIALRLGIVTSICQTRTGRKEGDFVNPNTGKMYPTSAAYKLDMRQGVAQLGYTEAPMKQELLDVFVDDGHLWSRVKKIDRVTDRKFVAVTTSTGGYLTHVGRSHNCSSTQQLADEHVASIGAMLQTDVMEVAYPAMADRAVDKYGHSKGWKRNRLRTADGFIIDALGLDTAARGMKVEDMRPDLICLDDIDEQDDTPGTVAKKIRAITRKILPAGARHVGVIAVQNLVHPESIFARLVSTGEPGEPEPAHFLATRRVSGPIPAVYDLDYEHVTDVGGRTRWLITGGEPSWPEGLTLAECQHEIDTFGIEAFLAECQHQEPDLRGGWFDHLDFTDQGPIRIPEALVPDLVRTVVTVDPAVTATDKSDSCGIVVASLGRDRNIYVQWAWEQIASPADAMRVAITAAIEFGASDVIVETDQGGDTWKLAYETVRKAVVEEIVADNGGEIPDGLFLPRFGHEKAGSTGDSKRARIAKLRVDYDVGPRIRHVGGGAHVLERGLRRFPLFKPHDVVDSLFWSRYWLGKKGGGDLPMGGRTRTRAAKGALPSFSPSSLPGAR